MELSKLINAVSVIQVSGEVERKDIASICYDSRKVKGNSLFVAIKGFSVDGHKFILDAINKGATAVILEDDSVVPEQIFIHHNITKIFVRNSRKALAEIANAFFKEPSRKINLIGITGTNGKTTTSYIIKNILEKCGEKAGLIGTISILIGNRKISSKLTTPESNDLNELFSEMIEEGCKYAVMEVSSHSLALKRVEKINFSSAIYANIAHDHLDFHHTFEEYLAAKKILFDMLEEPAFALYNSDDEKSIKMIKDTKVKCYSYGKSDNSDFLIQKVNYDLSGTSFTIKYKNKSFPVKTPLVGEFNAYNVTAAFATALLFGLDADAALLGIKNVPQVPGRFEIVGKSSKKAIIDYSHTPDSLEKTLIAIKNITKDNIPVYTIVGCGGDRDALKRPVMGKIASEYSKKTFITSDNPRFEDPIKIIDDIVKGITKDNFEIIEDRRKAIEKAIKEAEEESVILIAGKGHEDYQEIKGVRNHFSDKEIAENYLN